MRSNSKCSVFAAQIEASKDSTLRMATFEKRTSGRQKKKKLDPFIYMGYADDNDSVESIEAKFAMLDYKEKQQSDLSAEEIAKEVFVQTLEPTQVPIDVWYDLENWGEEEELFPEDEFEPGYYDGDDEAPIRGGRMRRSHSLNKGDSEQSPNFANFTQVDHLGSGIELWPDYKLKALLVDTNIPNINNEFPNMQEGISQKQFIESCAICPIYTVSQMNPQVIAETAAKHMKSQGFQDFAGFIDAIIMDVPFGHNGWNPDTFHTFLSDLKTKFKQSFFVIWADPEHLPYVVEEATALDLKFCDSISCELLTGGGAPLDIRLENGFSRETRMLVMYRTDDISRNDLAQQRIKDTGWGVSAIGGKTYDRYSMPMVAHKIIETMLPQRSGKSSRKRVFVELWPSTFSRREGWIMINEKESEEDHNFYSSSKYGKRKKF